jgi:hypothetical protein
VKRRNAMTRTILSSLAFAAMASMEAQPVPAQSYNPKELPMHWNNVPKGVRKSATAELGLGTAAQAEVEQGLEA